MAGAINLSATSGVAPCLVVGDCSGTTATSESLDLCRVQWDWDAASDSLNPRQGEGICRSYVYEQAGVYQVSVTVTDPASTAQVASQVVTVAAFSGTERYVAANGNDADPGTEALPWRTFDFAMAQLRQALAGSPFVAVPYRVRFRRGDAFTTATGCNFGTGAVGKVIIGAYGLEVAKPLITCTGTVPLFTASIQPVDFAFVDLDLRGTYDVLNGIGHAGPLVTFPHTYHASAAARANWLFLRCDFSSCYQGLSNSAVAVSALPQMIGIGVIGCTFGDVKHLHVDLGAKWLAVTGCTMGDTTIGGAHLVGILRVWWADRADISENSAIDPSQDYPAFELGAATDISNPTQWVTVYHSQFDGGHPTVGLRPVGGAGTEYITHVNFERCRISGAFWTYTLLNVSATDVTVRSCVLNCPDSFASFVRAVDLFDFGQHPARVRLLFNGFGTDNASGAVLCWVSDTASTAVVMRGNLMHAAQALPLSGNFVMLKVDSGGFSLAEVDDSQNYIWAPGTNPVDNNGTQIAWSAWQTLGHGVNSRWNIDPDLMVPESGDFRPRTPALIVGCNPVAQQWDDYYGVLRERPASQGRWSYGPVNVTGNAGNKVLTYDWSDCQAEITTEAHLTISNVKPWVAASVSVAATTVDAKFQKSDVVLVASLQRPTVAATVPGNASVATLGGTAFDWPATQFASVIAAPRAVAGFQVSDLLLNCTGTQPTIAATTLEQETAFVPEINFVWLVARDDVQPTASTGTKNDQAPVAVADRVGVQLGNVVRLTSLTVRSEGRKPPGCVIYAGMALSSLGELQAPLVAGEPFAGFAVRFAGVGTIRFSYVEVGRVAIAIVGVTSSTDLGKTVYASSDATFTLTSAGNSAIGKIVRHIYGTTCVVRFEAAYSRSLT